MTSGATSANTRFLTYQLTLGDVADNVGKGVCGFIRKRLAVSLLSPQSGRGGIFSCPADIFLHETEMHCKFSLCGAKIPANICTNYILKKQFFCDILKEICRVCIIYSFCFCYGQASVRFTVAQNRKSAMSPRNGRIA